MDRNSSRITKIALGVTLALTGAQVGLSSSANALTLLDSSGTAAPFSIATSENSSNGYAESAMTDRMIIKYREAASQTMTALEASDHIEMLSQTTNIKMQFLYARQATMRKSCNWKKLNPWVKCKRLPRKWRKIPTFCMPSRIGLCSLTR
jgi:hypothetical protein